MSRSYLHLSLALILLVASLGAYLYCDHLLGSVSDDVATLTNQVAVQKANAEQLTAAATELDTLSAEEGAIESYFVPQSDVVSFLEKLQTLGSAEGAKVTVVSVSAATDVRPHLSLSLSITGPFDAVMRTVGAIEYAPYDLTVGTLTLDTTDTTDAKDWNATMTVSVGTASSSPAVLAPHAATTTATTTP